MILFNDNSIQNKKKFIYITIKILRQTIPLVTLNRGHFYFGHPKAIRENALPLPFNGGITNLIKFFFGVIN